MKLSLTSFLLIAFIATGCVTNNLNTQKNITNSVELITDNNVLISSEDGLKLSSIIDRTLSYDVLNKEEIAFINKNLPLLKKDIQINVKTALKQIEIFKEGKSYKSTFNTNEKNKDILIKLSLNSNLPINLEFDNSGIFIDDNLLDSVHYGFCNSYSQDQRKLIEKDVFDKYKKDEILVIYGKNFETYISYLKVNFPLASFAEIKANKYDEFVTRILDIQESKDRKDAVQTLDKNTNLVFFPRKNQNLKKIFIILDYADAKAIVPILKNYVLDFPIFATNDLLYGITDPKKILDFEGLYFPLDSKTMSSFVKKDLKAGTLKDEFNKSILKELLFQQKLNAAGIKKSYVKTAISDVEFKVSSCNKRTIRISSIGDNT